MKQLFNYARENGFPICSTVEPELLSEAELDEMLRDEWGFAASQIFNIAVKQYATKIPH
jgi:hypothetical protein